MFQIEGIQVQRPWGRRELELFGSEGKSKPRASRGQQAR